MIIAVELGILDPLLSGTPWEGVLGVVGVPLTFLIMVCCVAFAVLYEGAVDPRLTLRKTTIFGSLSALAVLAFAVIETLASDLLAARFGLPGSSGSIIAGASVGFGFRATNRALTDRVGGWVDRLLPDTELAESTRHEAVIVFSDIVGYSALTSENEDDALTMMSVFHRIARRAAEQAKGRLVKTMGDGVIMEFKDAAKAVAASQQLVASFRDTCEPLGLPEGRLRTGIHFGEVAKRRDGDLFGDTVNIASRLESEAEPGQIVLSQAAADQLDGVELEDLGEQKLKNVPEPVRCHAVRV